MADGIRVDTHELDRAIAAVERSLEDLAAANQAAAEALLPAVAQRTPVRTGRLAASWSATAGVIESDEEYAGAIEYGDPDRGIEGAHMARDAVAASERDLVDAYEIELGRIMRRAGFELRS